MSATVVVPCWRVWGWNRDTLQWTLRSHHPTREEAEDAAHDLIDTQLIRARISESTRKKVVASEAPAPTEAKAFREAQADKVVLRRQTHTYFKSGCNGTELLDETDPL